MEFSADTKSLAEALDQVEEAVEKKSTIPITCRLPNYAESELRSLFYLPCFQQSSALRHVLQSA